MEKTKLGISVSLMAAAVYLLGLLSGYTVTILLVGYILLKEEDLWLKKQSVGALALMLVFSVISTLLGIIPDLFGMLNSVIGIFGGYLHLSIVDNLLNLAHYALGILKTVAFLLLAVAAAGKGKFEIPGLNKLLDKLFD